MLSMWLKRSVMVATLLLSCYSSYSQFVTTWKTDNSGTSNDDQITIPTTGTGYNYSVDWGDGNSDTGVTGDITHTYASAGTYTVSISGDFPQIYFNNTGDKDKLLTIEQWGDVSWASMNNAFYGCSNMDVNAIDAPDLSLVTTTARMFFQASSFNGSIGHWDMSNIEIMNSMFRSATSFNQDIGGWDVSSVEMMAYMFSEATSFNQDLNNWDVSQVTHMGAMFWLASAFNGEVSTWDVSHVTNMSSMFSNAESFEQDISAWDLSSVTNLNAMFDGASAFNQDLSSWDVSNVADMTRMFENSGLSRPNYDATLKGWSAQALQSNVVLGADGLTYCTSESERQKIIDDFNWTISGDSKSCNTESAILSFQLPGQVGVTRIDKLNRSVWIYYLQGEDRSSLIPEFELSEHATFELESGVPVDFSGGNQWTVTAEDGSTSRWFVGIQEIDPSYFVMTVDLSLFNPGNRQITIPTEGTGYNYNVHWGDDFITQNITGDGTHTYAESGIYTIQIWGDFPRMFYSYDDEALRLVSIDHWGDGQWTSMARAFEGCENMVLKATDAPDLSNVTDMSRMFAFAYNFNQSINHWDVSNVSNMHAMFGSASSFNQPLNNWDVSNVTDMSEMFAGASSFNQDIGGWSMENVQDISSMFFGAADFNQDLNWTLSNLTDMSSVFMDATSFNGDVSGWDITGASFLTNVFKGATSFNGDISAWDTKNITVLFQTFEGATSFNQDISSWDVSGVNNLTRTFAQAAAFNQDITSWDVGNGFFMTGMFQDATVFDQDLSSWDISAAHMDNMFDNSGLSPQNYDKTLFGWASQALNSGVTLGASSITYCKSETARQSIISTYGWTINDAGKSCLDETDVLTFAVEGQFGEVIIDPANHLVEAEVLFGNDLSGLVPTLTLSPGASISVTEGDPQDFTSDLVVTVTAENGVDTQNWTLRVTTYAGATTAFRTTWKTDNTGTSNDDQITIPTDGTGYNYSVDWGDGNTDNNVTGDITHTYAAAGTYTVEITGSFPGIYFNNSGDAQKLLTIEQWGDNRWLRLSNAFYGCSNLTYNAADDPDLGLVTDISGMFRNASLFDGDLSGWDVSEITNMQGLFNGASTFNQDISSWNVGHVTTMQEMFSAASAFNQNIGSWDVSKVTNMRAMFSSASDFNQDIGGWDVSNVNDMYYMFAFASDFNQNIDAWNVGKVTDMVAMFFLATSFNQALNNWDVSSVSDMNNMFNGASAFNGAIGNWDMSNVSVAFSLFINATAFNQDISNWDVTGIESLAGMFRGATSFNQDISSWDVSNATSIWQVFLNATAFNQDLSSWDVSGVTDMRLTFSGATAFDQDLSSWDISQVAEMDNFLDNSGISRPNYDATLQAWSQLSLKSNVTMGSSGLTYCTSATERQKIIDDFNWAMIGDALECETGVEIVDVALPILLEEPSIDASNHEINLVVSGGIDLTQLAPIFELSENATIAPASGASNDFSSPVTFTVTAEDGITTQEWVVSVTTNQTYFTTTWKTDNTGKSDDNQIIIPTESGFTYNYTVYWGDGTKSENVTGDITHNYPEAGSYVVSITGDFPSIYFNNEGDKEKITTIKQWGDISWSSLENAFYGCRNLTCSATDAPDLSSVTSLQNTFRDASSFNGSIGDWDVSAITNLNSTFSYAGNFNQDIGNWDVGSVIYMSFTFGGARTFNQDISNWDTGNVQFMIGTFNSTVAFNQPIGSWNTSKVESMLGMFSLATAFNQDISNWDVSSVTNMSFMFNNAQQFNQDLNAWDVSNVMDMSGLFILTTSFDQDLSGWDVSSATNMENMFFSSNMSRVNYDETLIAWSTQNLQQNVTLGANNLTYCTSESARQSIIDDFNWTFNGDALFCSSETDILSVALPTLVAGPSIDLVNHEIDLEVAEGTDLTNLAPVFEVSAGATIDPESGSSFDFSTPVTYTVAAEDGTTSQDWVISISTNSTYFSTTWKTDNPGTSNDNQVTIPTNGSGYNYTVDWGDGSTNAGVTGDITHTYASPGMYTISITGDFPRIYFNNTGDKDKLLNIVQWGDLRWKSFENAFYGCSNMNSTATDVPDLSLVDDMSQAFKNATVFNGEMGGWDVSQVTDMGGLFSRARAFDQDIGAWDVSSVQIMQSMFIDADVFNQDISSWDVSNVVQMTYMFGGANSFDQDLSSWDVSNVILMDWMFFAATSFNQDIGSWDVSNVIDMSGMLAQAFAFDQDISSWDVSSVTNMHRMLESNGLSDQNYDLILQGWSQQTLSSNVTLGASGISYCKAATERQSIIDNFGWTISDDGFSCLSETDILFAATENVVGPIAIDATNHTVSLSTIEETDLSDLAVSFELSPGATISPDTGSPQDFTNPVTYTVTAEDGSTTQEWTISVSRDASYFVTTWKTNNEGNGENDQITIQTSPALSYNFTVYWGDGNSDTNVTGNITHTYASPGTYTISITGTFPSMYFGSILNDKLLSVDQWGSNPWQSMERAFFRCRNVEINATDVPDLSNVTSTRLMFSGATAMNNDLSDWDMSNVQDMSTMFSNTEAFNQDISGWDVSNVTNMEDMFYNADGFNQDIGDWDVSAVTDMDNMFAFNDAFDQDISAWDVSNVTDMSFMFLQNNTFNQPLNDWDVSKVTDMSYMFQESSFDQDINDWDVSNVTNTKYMFNKASAFNQPLDQWDVSHVTDMEFMFAETSQFDQDLGNWDVGSVQNFLGMFFSATAFNQDIGGWDVSSATTMRSLFYLATDFDQDIGNWDVSNVQSMFAMFYAAENFNQDLSDWEVTSVTDMSFMLDLSGMSNENYDNLLEGWSAHSVQSNVVFGVDELTYCTAEEARQILIDTYNWTLNDEGQSCDGTEILNFVFDQETGTAIIDNSSQTITSELANGTDLTAVAPASITLSYGATVSPGEGDVQDFTNDVIYTVSSADGTSADWTVTVTVAPSNETDIFSFELTEQTGAATINTTDHTIAIEVANGTDVTSLTPTIEVSTAASINPGSGAVQDFSSAVTYTVTAEDGTTTQDWLVTVTEASSTATDILSFMMAEQTGAATINTTDHTIAIEVANGTDLTNLIPTIEVSMRASITPESGTAQDFSSVVTFTVTAEDGTTSQDWLVTVTEAPATATDILSFELAEQTGAATINTTDHTIGIEVANGTDLTNLIPTIEISAGASITPESGTAQDFSSVLTFTVTAEDGTTSQDWLVTVTESPATATDILSFELAEQTGAATINTTDHTITVEVANGTDLTSLIPTIEVSTGASITPESGTAQDFSSVVTFTVTAEAGTTTQDWLVTVTESPATATDILSFELAEQTGAATINTTDHTIAIEVANGTDLTNLIPTIEVSMRASITPESGTAQDFSSVVTFTVTAEDGTTSQDWLVTVTEAPSTATNILSFELTEQTGAATINTTDHTIAIEVANGTDLTNLIPTIEVSTAASINPGSGAVQDFSSTVTYTVIAEDGNTTQDWLVTVTEAPSTATDILSFVLAEQTGAATINTTDHTITIEVANGTDLISLTPTIGISSGARISPTSGAVQDFSSVVTYTVTAEAGTTTQDWLVTVTEATSTATDILSFVLAEQTRAATINTTDHTIAIEVSNGTDLTSLTPTIGISSGASISPTSGVLQDFTSAVTYTVTAEDGTTTQDWAVTVTEAPSTATDILSFELVEQTGEAIINTEGHTVEIEVFRGTDLNDLAPTIVTSEGANISPGSGIIQDFSTPVTYTVTAEDGITTQDWAINVFPESPLSTAVSGPIQLYPNPVTSELSITIENTQIWEWVSVSDISGKEVIRVVVNKPQMTINVDQLRQGVYILQLEGANEILRSRFIKE